MDVYQLLLLALIGSIVSLVGGGLLLANIKIASSVARLSGPFAAGALIMAVFFDLIPEAIEFSEESDSRGVFIWLIVGIVVFFLLERRLRWFHHHHEHEASEKTKTLPVMLVLGDTIHNAIDGAAIAFAFLVSPSAGVVTTVAVALHELPQEIGDFGLLLKAGWSRRKVMIANLFSALATVVMAMIVYFLGSSISGAVAPTLALTSGMLLYIALSDILPSVHENKSSKKWLDSSNLLFIAGLLVVYIVIGLSHHIEG